MMFQDSEVALESQWSSQCQLKKWMMKKLCNVAPKISLGIPVLILNTELHLKCLSTWQSLITERKGLIWSTPEAQHNCHGIWSLGDVLLHLSSNNRDSILIHQPIFTTPKYIALASTAWRESPALSSFQIPCYIGTQACTLSGKWKVSPFYLQSSVDSTIKKQNSSACHQQY